MDSFEEYINLHWTTIVVTCSSPSIREGVEEECKRLSSGGLLPQHDFLLVLDDPRPEIRPSKHDSELQSTPGVGSGGATINALLVAIERLSAQHHHTTINSELVHSSRILVVHYGRLLLHSPGGTAFLRLSPKQTFVPPSARTTPPTLLQHAIWMTTKMSAKSKTGVWVTSLDAFLPYSLELHPPDTDGIDGAIVCTVAAPLEHAVHHGVVVAEKGQDISKMEYRLPLEELRKVFPGGVSAVISGIVFLSASLTEQLLGLHTVPPLDCCTYYGTDSGVSPLQLSLYFDLLLPLCSAVHYEEYISGQCGTIYAQAASYNTLTQQESRSARLQIWKQLQGHKITFHPLQGVQHHYMGANLSFQDSLIPLLPSSSILLHDTFIGHDMNEHVVIVNSVIEGSVKSLQEKLYIIDSAIGKNVSITSVGPGVLSGLQLQESNITVELPGGQVWQMYPGENYDVVTCHGFSDDLSKLQHDTKATVFNTLWSVFYARTGLEKKDLWPHTNSKYQTVITAKFFVMDRPVVEQIRMMITLVGAVSNDQRQQEWMLDIQEWKTCTRVSLLDVATKCDLKKLVRQREDIYLETVKRLISDTADEVGGKSLLPYFSYLATRGQESVEAILHELHKQLQRPRTSTPRLLANAADLLGCMAAGRGGLRSGPAANPQWRNALVELKAGNQKEAVDHMTMVCTQWMKSGHPEDLIRAARHYERASQIVISQQVETAVVHVSTMWVAPELRQKVDVGVWVEAHSPARIDLAGGWSDTPPICYEQGGAVLNIAIKINKKKPIGARVRIVPELYIACVLRDWSGGDVRLTWTELDHLCDYDNPVSPGALVKAVLLYCQLVDLNSEDSLVLQLKNRFGGGVEIEVWSHLPQGSGLGGSSLLAGTLLSAIVVLLGYPLPRHSHLIHATLCIEQWLTTGGGWQDQVGGLLGGAKLGVSSKGTPVTVSTYKIPLSQEFVSSLNDHLLLLYTGKVRLARNLLQTVIRNWYARDPNITSCFSQLQQLALQAAGAMLGEDLKMLGSCINNYWRLKKMVASGCETSKVSKLMATLQDHCAGISLAGAGGGGYLYALKAKPGQLADDINLGGLTSDCVEVDEHGLELCIGGESVAKLNEDKIFLTREKLKTLFEN
ncbi:L-fucose kinase-like isoform X2 [Homarus americanus]|uniref:L-fucose kinase-like isoform X2 n=1 Tax=Homarus americanus TaxID=6706 RepID=UPI001C46DD5E|nr:L-fucose kinase-like isoform X2 [Homarus americanus]